MKYLFTVLLVLGCLSNICIRCQDNSANLFQEKIDHYTKLRNAGWGMTVVGIGATTAGIAFLVSYLSDYPYVQSKYNAGLYLTTAGIVMTGAGITLKTIGTHKRRFYKKQLNNLSISPVIAPDHGGFLITYRL